MPSRPCERSVVVSFCLWTPTTDFCHLPLPVDLPLLAVAVGAHRRHSLEAPVRRLGDPGGGNAQHRRFVHRQAHDVEPGQVPSSARGEFERTALLACGMRLTLSLFFLTEQDPVDVCGYEDNGRLGHPVHLHRHCCILRRHPCSLHCRIPFAHARRRLGASNTSASVLSLD